MTDKHNWDFPDDLLEAAWGIIANASDWDLDREWRKAAERWRDAYHETLRTGEDETPRRCSDCDDNGRCNGKGRGLHIANIHDCHTCGGSGWRTGALVRHG